MLRLHPHPPGHPPRHTFTSLADLTTAIETHIDDWNEHSHPFTWTKTADELLAKIRTPKTETDGLTDH
jgi:hypothetical protein